MATDRATRSESELIDRARAGDEAAFASLVASEQPRARAVAWRITRDPSAADEIAHEAFVRLHGALPAFREDAALSTWLYRTIVNLCHDRARRAEREHGHVSLSEAIHMASRDPEPDQATEAAERARHVDAAVAALPEPMRDVVVLRYVRGLGYDEIAQVLGCPAGTVASRIHRALRVIAALLATHGIREGSL